MGLFSVLSPRASSNPTRRKKPHRSDRRPSRNAHTGDTDYDRPVSGSRKPPYASDPRTTYRSRKQGGIQVIDRNPEDTYKESFYKITPETGTDYPCTQEELNVLKGPKWRMTPTGPVSCTQKSESKRVDHPNKGPFLDAMIAAREVFEHNDPTRIPSVAENEAIRRLDTVFKDAAQRFWGPDLAIKAFCDLDKVFFCARLTGHIYLSWKRNIGRGVWGKTGYLGRGKAVILLGAYNIFFHPEGGSGFVHMFATLLHEMCHAYLRVRALDSGPKGWNVGRPDGHGKNFGTMIYVVNRRAKDLFGFEGDSMLYLRHDYVLDDDDNLRPAPEQRPPSTTPPHTHPSQSSPPRDSNKPAASRKSRRERYNEACRDVTLDSGTDYACSQSDLDVTGGLARQAFPEDARADRSASHKAWFPQPNRGPFTSPKQACLEIFQHNSLRRKPGELEQEAIERLFKAIRTATRDDIWGPDLIIKAFCDLDVVFFAGRLRGHCCVRWLREWTNPKDMLLGTTVFLGGGKVAIRLNADTILLHHPEPVVCMFATMLHEMCHADARIRVREKEMLECVSHGKGFGTKYHAVDKRARKLFNFTLNHYAGQRFPRFKYEIGEGFP